MQYILTKIATFFNHNDEKNYLGIGSVRSIFPLHNQRIDIAFEVSKNFFLDRPRPIIRPTVPTMNCDV